jgi:hypothetical protein
MQRFAARKRVRDKRPLFDVPADDVGTGTVHTHMHNLNHAGRIFAALSLFAATCVKGCIYSPLIVLLTPGS